MTRMVSGKVAGSLTAAALIVGIAGCTASPEGNAPSVILEPGPVLADTPLALEVSGVDPGETVTVEARGTQTGQVVSATFTANNEGQVDLLTDTPTDGSYDEASGYGLLWQLPAADALGPLEVTVSTTGAEDITRTQDRRLAAADVKFRRLRPTLAGLSGRFFYPADRTEKRPAVVIFGGSEGGLSTEPEAQLLASRGYPTLALAYFGAPGLPKKLERIPIGYFERALVWLSKQPGVDPDRIVPYGISRGSEAALLVAARSPRFAAGAIGFAPNGVAVGSPEDPYEPAWTWKQKPVPWAQTRREWWYDPGDAAIDVWRIDGPVLLVCGAADQVWASCSQADDIATRLTGRGRPAPTVMEFDDVGHEIGFAVPGAGGAGTVAGDDLEATGLARAAAWQAVLDYLADL